MPSSRRLTLDCLEDRLLLTAGPDFRLNTTTLLDQRTPVLAGDAIGGYAAAWIGHNSANGTNDVYAQRLDPFGEKVGAEFVVNEFTAGAQDQVAVAAGLDGRFVVVWTGPEATTGTLGLFFRVYEGDGTPVTGDVLVNPTTLGLDSDPAVAMDGLGRFNVSWTRQDGADTDVYVQRFDANGGALNVAFQADRNFIGRQSNTAIAMDSLGNYVVVWQVIGAPLNEVNVAAQRFTPSGVLNGQVPITSITSSNEVTPAVSLKEILPGQPFGAYVVAWSVSSTAQPNGVIQFQRRAGTAAGDKLGTDVSVTSNTENSVLPAAGYDPYDRWVIGWQSVSGGQGTLKAQRFNADGSSFDAAPTVVNTLPAVASHGFSMALGRNGGLMGWTYQDVADGLDAYAQRFFPNNPVITELSGDVSGNEGSTFSFHGEGFDPNDDPITFHWDLDDDGQFDDATGQDASVVLADNGLYRVGLKIQDDHGNWIRGFLSIVVVNVDPTAMILDVPAVGEADVPIDLGSSVVDPGTLDTHTYSWTVTLDDDVVASGSDADFSFTPDTAGTYVVHLTVTDNDNGQGEDEETIIVLPSEPVITELTGDLAGDEGGTFSFHADGFDPNGDPITFHWDLDNDGAFDDATGQDASLVLADNGAHQIGLEIRDDGGHWVRGFLTVVVANVNPTATIVNAPDEGQAGVAIDLNSTVADPGILDTHVFAWTVTRDGDLVASGDAADFNFVPAVAGTYVVHLTATDNDNGQGDDEVTIEVLPAEPVITVLTGDVTGDEGDTFAFHADGFDPNGDAITFQWDLDNDGEFDDAVGQDASVVFADNGTYQVGLEIRDDLGNFTRGFLDVVVANVDPTATILDAPTEGETGVQIDLHSFVTDAGTLDTHTYSWTVTRDGNPFASGNNVDISFTPDGAGTYVVDLTVTDDDGGVGTDEATVIVEEDEVEATDLVLVDVATPLGNTQVDVTYQVVGSSLTQAVQISVYLSKNSTIDALDVVRATYVIQPGSLDANGLSALSTGSHVLRLNTSQLNFPNDGTHALSTTDYYLLARLDAGNAVAEPNEGNNDVAYDGVYRLAGDGGIFVHGTNGADVVTIQDNGCNVHVNLGAASFSYASSSVRSYQVRLHGGNDCLKANGARDVLLGFGGDGADQLTGGESVDVIYGGAGADCVKGLGGWDFLSGQGGDDLIDGGGGWDLILGGAGSDTLYGGGGIDLLLQDSDFAFDFWHLIRD